MPGRWRIAKDDEADAFLDEICAELQSLFNLSVSEARARIEQGWRHLGDAEFGGAEEIAYHESPGYWAHNFYYGKDSFWWITGTDRETLQLAALAPIPLRVGT